jgi:probable HAF family extracellular repeat protein
MQDLGLLDGDFLSVAPCCRTINDRREVVGFSIGSGGPRAVLWQNGVPTDLNQLSRSPRPGICSLLIRSMPLDRSRPKL